MVATMMSDQPVGWLDNVDGFDALERGLIDCLRAPSHDIEEQGPSKRPRLSVPESNSPTVERILLESMNIRATMPVPSKSRMWALLEEFQSSQDPLPIAFSAPIHEPDPTQADKYIATVDLYNSSMRMAGIGQLQLQGLNQNQVKFMQIIHKTQQQAKTTHKSYSEYKKWFEDMAMIPEIYFKLDDGDGAFVLHLRLTWQDGKSFLDVASQASKKAAEAFNLFTQSNPREYAWSPQDFYESTFTPSVDIDICAALNNDFLGCSLYPFQKRTVQFMLAREGAVVIGGKFRSSWDMKMKSKAEPIQTGAPRLELPISYEADISNTNNPDTYVVSRTFGTISRDGGLLKAIQAPSGGILAEEMGLGKTVELIALIALHTREVIEGSSEMVKDQYSNRSVRQSSATLIITPPHLVQQWQDEIALHAPNMRVCTYEGVHTLKDQNVQALATFDVVITTYSVLAREIWYIDAKPKRELRHKRKHIPPTSALTEIQWWRVCLDEAQMVENALSNTAVVARCIPRINSWAVSGTPFKNHVTDLHGLLKFLRFEPFDDRKIWSRVDKLTFRQIFKSISIRHTKDKVHHELRLPLQKRYVLTIPFLAIEEQHYAKIFSDMCLDCGFNEHGSAMSGVDVNASLRIEKMRSWLRRLRQLCLHPQVGGKNRRALGTGKDVPLRTVNEVLKVMIEQNDNLLRTSERDVLEARLKQGHIHAFDGSNDERGNQSLILYTTALELIVPIVADCRAIYKASSSNEQSMKESDSDDKDPRSDKTREQQQKAISFRKALEMHHMCEFFVGTAHYQIKESPNTEKDSDQFKHHESMEVQHYDIAKSIRIEMLKEARQRTELTMRQVQKLSNRSLQQLELPEHVGGIENVKIMDKLSQTAEKLNDQIALIAEWRDKIQKILLKPLVDNDEHDEQTGEEYEDSTKEQDELYVLFLVLRTFIANRSTFVTGYVNPLVEHEAKQALKQASKTDEEDRGPAPDLMKGCLEQWQKLKPDNGAATLRGALADLRSLLTHLEWQLGQANLPVSRSRVTSEMETVKKHMIYAQETCNTHTKEVQDLEKELDQFRACMNSRLSFYKELQRISDMVKPFKEVADEAFDQQAFELWTAEEEKAQKALAGFRTKSRFFEHLQRESDQEAQRMCVICQSDFENGCLTVCGHQYCQTCIREWWHSHRTCPLCKRQLRLENLHDITYKPRQLQAQEEGSAVKMATNLSEEIDMSESTSSAIYTTIRTASLDQIKSIDLPRSFGTKLDTLARHLLWLREVDPGAKSIIFTQFTEFLDVLASAFTAFKIGFASISKKGNIDRFRRDPSIECFLLDAKSDSSGLNLVNATHVFLCEPLVNPAIELQAIARVHRIGQMRSTTVWMSLIKDSVEEAVYHLSVGRRMQHIAQQKHEDQLTSSNTADNEASTSSSKSRQQQNEMAIDAANSAELQSVPVNKLLLKGAKVTGELVDQDDLWTCLFSKTQAGTRVNESLRAEMDRHYRAEAAEDRRVVEEETSRAAA